MKPIQSGPSAVILQEVLMKLPIKKQQAPIVIAEDNFVTARLLASSLQAEGCTTVIARDGDEAVALINKHNPDLLLLNLNLSRPSGVELLRTLQLHRSRLRVIAVTTPGQADMKSVASSLGVSAFFEVPFHPAELLQQVRLVLGL